MKKEHFGQYLIESIVKRYDSSVKMPEWIGCTNAEIEALMKAQGVTELPKAYREYLQIMGKYGVMSRGTSDSWRYEDLLHFKQELKEAITFGLETEYTLPDDIFVIYQALGSVFHYFRTSESELRYPVYLLTDHRSPDGKPYSISRIANTIEEYFMRKAGLLASSDNTTSEDK